LFSSCHRTHFTFSLLHLPDFVWDVVLLRDDASEAALPAFGEELLFTAWVMWNKADTNNSGTLEGNEAVTYLDAIRKSRKEYDMKTLGQLSSFEFMPACKDEAFKIWFYRT